MITKLGNVLTTIGKGLGAVSNAVGGVVERIVPITTTGFAAYNVATGEQSVGEALGDAVGTNLGMTLGEKGFKSLHSKIDAHLPTKSIGSKINKVVGHATPFIGSIAGSVLLSGALEGPVGKILPFRREPKVYNYESNF